MGRRILNRKDLRADFEAAERRGKDEEEEVEDEEAAEIEAPEAEAPEAVDAATEAVTETDAADEPEAEKE